MKKVLVLGATGAIATYMIPAILQRGMSVTGVSLDDMTSDNPHLRYLTGDAMDLTFLQGLLAEGYDAVVDFMVYKTKEQFSRYYPLFLANTAHYIFLSTYRIYAWEHPLREDSLRLLDAPRPDDFVAELEYSIYKAEEEDLLHASGYRNFTIVRPAITYSKCRFQLTTLEADVVVARMRAGKTVLLPEGAIDREATMSWAGDVGYMLAHILFNERAYGEVYTTATSEHHTWREIAEMYGRIGGLTYQTVPDETYIEIVGGSVASRQQLKYDRCYDRIVDNAKILDLCGLKQADLMPLEEGLRMEYESLTEQRLTRIGTNTAVNERMDAYLAAYGK